MPISWVTRHQSFGGTNAYGRQLDAIEQYKRSMQCGGARVDLFRVTHKGDIEDYGDRQRVEHAVFELPADVPTGMTASAAGGIIVQHVLSSED